MLNIATTALCVTMKKIGVVVSTVLTSPTMIFIVNLQMQTIVIVDEIIEKMQVEAVAMK